jgi:hypothetical protein
MIYWPDYSDATSGHFWQQSQTVSDTTYGETIVYVLPYVPKGVSKVCGERYRLAQSGCRVRSVTDVHRLVRIRSPTLELR